MTRILIGNPDAPAFEAAVAEGVCGLVQGGELRTLLRLDDRLAWLVETEARRRDCSTQAAITELLSERIEQIYGDEAARVARLKRGHRR